MDWQAGERPRVAVRLLGELEVTRDGAVVPVPGARLRELLALLAVHAGRPVDAGVLVDALWPRARPADPANALQSLVSRLRRVLGAPAAVVQVGSGYCLGGAEVDAVRVEELAGRGRTGSRTGDPDATAGLAEAVALCRGPVAAELVAVAPAVATRLALLAVDLHADLAEAQLRQGRYGEVAARLPGLLADHPLHERLAALAMDALAGQGRQAEALLVYERIRRDLAEELGADPGAALRERHLALLREERPPGAPEPRPAARDSPDLAGRDSPAEPGAELPAGSLPAPVTSFVGRADELGRVDTLLATGRLVTVLGPGGAGKTRLALEAARRRHGRYRDGAWLVDLAPVTEPAEVTAAIIAALGLRDTALFERPGPGRTDGGDLLAVLVDRLAPGEHLLLVDNCEHLVDTVALVTATLLARCPGLHVLATSREPLAMDGEALVPVAPLAVPAADAGPVEALAAPAVRLFHERAAAVQPGFTVDSATVRDVVEVVRRLDGLPLALELAAARLRTLPLAELTAGLSDRFRLLTGGSRTALPRHRTLRAVIAWSWDLLSPAERDLAERVAVLPAGVTPESAAAVSAGTGIAEDEVPELLSALVDRSLLHLAGPGPRYRMLESLREYGIERLVEQGALSTVRQHAAGYLAALVARTDPQLRTSSQLPALRLLRAEYDNALTALRHFCDSGDAAAALRLAIDLCWFWQMLGRHAESVYWLREALAVPGEVDPVLRDWACAVRLFSLHNLDPSGRTAEYAETLSTVPDLIARLASRAEPRQPISVLASVALYMAGEVAIASARIDQAVTHADPWTSALARLFRARVAENAGDVDQVRVDADRALATFQALGDRWGQATALPIRALLRQYDADLDGALADLQAARALSDGFGSLDLNDEIFLDLRRCDLHQRRDEPEQAMAALAAARGRAGRAGTEMVFLIDALESGLRAHRGELDRAEELLRRAESGLLAGQGRTPVGGDHGRAIIGVLRAVLHLSGGRTDAAGQALTGAYAAALDSHDMPLVSFVAATVARLAAARGDFPETATLLGAATRIRGAEDPTEPNSAGLARDCRAALGEQRFAAAYAAGRDLDRASAVRRIDPDRPLWPDPVTPGRGVTGPASDTHARRA